MSKPRPTPAPPAQPPGAWTGFLLVGLCGFLLGATVMYFALRRPAPAAVETAPSGDPATHVPDPALTAGQPPAQAERTLGNFYYDHQNWPLAIQHYEAAIRQGSDDADIRTDLGNAYRFAGRPEDALAQYTLAQKMNPAHEFSLFNQGGLYYEDFRQPARAVEIWQEYLTRFPAGRNVAAARQLIAQAQGGTAGPGLPPAAAIPTAPALPGSASEDLILRQLQSARSKDPRP